MRAFVGLLFLAVAGCSVQSSSTVVPLKTHRPTFTSGERESVAQNFAMALRHMRPVILETCAQATKKLNCDFYFELDSRSGAPPNAFQSIRSDGRPVLGFSLTLLMDMRSKDEMAFVIGHEASHHILGHLNRQRKSAKGGAVIFGVLAAALGGSIESVDAAVDMGAAVGARNYSKDYELEADRLGAKMTFQAGYDPVLGAAYFTRIVDPGNKFLGTHPPNSARIAAVRVAVGR